jgi:predicted phosphate transport protein (TIGR00153 family)
MANVAGYFSNVFGHSPFRDLQAHAQLCVNAVQELRALFPASFAANWIDVEKSYARLTELENAADEKKRTIRTHLPRGFFLPVARTDLLDLLGRQDELANTSRDIAGLVLGRHLQFPALLEAQVTELINTSVATCQQAQQIINQLDELIDTAFKGPRARMVITMIEEVEALEHETDEMVVKIRKDLFGIEDQLPPVQVMFLYKALDLLAELADGAERVAHRVQLMLAK